MPPSTGADRHSIRSGKGNKEPGHFRPVVAIEALPYLRLLEFILYRKG